MPCILQVFARSCLDVPVKKQSPGAPPGLVKDPWLDMDLTEKEKAEKAIESALPSAPPPVETNEAAEKPKTSLGAAAAVKEVTYSPDDLARADFDCRLCWAACQCFIGRWGLGHRYVK